MNTQPHDYSLVAPAVLIAAAIAAGVAGYDVLCFALWIWAVALMSR